MLDVHFPKVAQQIVEIIPNAFYVLDKSWNFVYANAQIEELLKKTNEELLGTYYWDHFPKASFENLYLQFHKASDEGVNVSVEEFSPVFQKWFEICAYPSPLGMAVYVTDITQRKATEQELIHAKEELQDFLDQATVGIHWVNEEGIIIYVNNAELELLGYTKDEYIGRNIAEFHEDQNAIQISYTV